jgi:3-methylcrotonyl-CoA carboxylase alpha subunit
MFRSLLIANRGEIARRVIRTARKLGLRTIAVMTEADRSWPHWREADEAIAIGEGPAAQSYLSIEKILWAARKAGAEAIHPGYGFLSENAAFAEACEKAGLIFVGPPAQAIRAMGSKAEAKRIMAHAGVPVVPGYAGDRQDADFLRQKAYELGYPVLIKAVAGGGGRGMRRIDRALDFDAGLASARREALSAFGDERVILERYVETPRHIEVQIFADAHGEAVHLFERDCSVQRRHQKVLEEAPAPGLDPELRAHIGAIAVRAALAVGYRGAGTVEFVADSSRGLTPDGIFFIEMNTRLQVEHPVTEAVTGLDLVEWQLRIAAGERLPLRQAEISLSGHAIEARLYAEDPNAGFQPSTGRLWAASFPSSEGVRVDAGVEEGSIVSPFYDAMLAKIIVAGADRDAALALLRKALEDVRVAGPKTNVAFLSAIAAHPAFSAGGVDTGFIDRELERLVGEPLPPVVAAPAIAAWLSRDAARHAAFAPGPWSRTDGFRPGGLASPSSIEIVLDDRPATAVIDWSAGSPRVVSIDGEDVAGPQGEIVWAGEGAYLLAEGRSLYVAFPDPLARDLAASLSGGEVLVPMHGRIVEVAAGPGGRVEKGDPLFTLEAMKMEHTIVAPIAGTIAEVRILPGAQAERGAIAVLISEDT